MKNDFVDYLNSLHNDLAANKNAIAELAISSPYFTTTQVKRELIPFLEKKINDREFIILTGHAGDGKTTLLAQLLENIGSHTSKLLPVNDLNLANGSKLHYVKDFSELVIEEQDIELKRCFQREGAALLIANTGPLLGSFRRLAGEEIEEVLLEAMDSTAGKTVSVSNFGKVYLLNIARVDNTDFIEPFLKNITEDKLWEPCKECSHMSVCPIYFNKLMVSLQFKRTVNFIENVYIWLQEYDHRATIRQMTAHLTFSFTGGLSCRAVERHGIQSWKYTYLFSNLFFGYKGIHPIKNARQIRAISLVNEEGFDRKQTCIDYELYTCTQYQDYFPESLASVISNTINGPMHRSKVVDQEILKRAYLFFGYHTNEIDKEVYKQVFSEWFDVYLNVRNKGLKPKTQVSNAIYQAINTLFIGDSGDEDISQINLTLRRNNEQLSNVQLLNGRIGIDDISLKCVPIETVFKNKKQYRLEFQTGKVKYPLGLPLVNYCCEIHHGIIMTDIDPLLSNGIDSLKAQLLSHAHLNLDDNQVQIVFLEGNKWVKRTLTINEHTIDH